MFIVREQPFGFSGPTWMRTPRNQNLWSALANPEDPPRSNKFWATSSRRAPTAWLPGAAKKRKNPWSTIVVKIKWMTMRMVFESQETMMTSKTTPKTATIQQQCELQERGQRVSSLSHSRWPYKISK